MTEETREELAALLALDGLEGDELEQALRLRREDPQFAALVDELEQAAMLMADAVPPATPSPALKQRLFKQLDTLPPADTGNAPAATTRLVGMSAAPAELAAATPTRQPAAGWLPGWAGWAAALALAIATGWTLVDRRQLADAHHRLATDKAGVRTALAAAEQRLLEIPELQARIDAARAELAEARTRSEELTDRLAEREMELARTAGALEDSAAELARLRQSNQLARTRIASLEATVEAYQTARVVVIWDEEAKRGVVQIEGLPELDAEQDYQFWVVDPNQEQPVDAGTIELDESGSARVDFEPRRPIAEASMFAISIEAAGGVPFNEGPIVLAGQ